MRKDKAMTNEDYAVSRFDGAVMLLTGELKTAYRALLREDRAVCEELRLRVGQRPSALLPDGEVELNFRRLLPADLDTVLSVATEASLHAVRDSLRNGFVTAAGGFRIGICGSASVQDGQVTGYRAVSSVCIRIPRQISCASPELTDRLFPGGKPCSALLISPPGLGKTTLLRELVRFLSNGGSRIALADERGEVAAMAGGVPQMDVGRRTDVLEGCRKAPAALMMLRAMNPQVVALDEITAPEDVAAVSAVASCGVKVLATVHGDGIGDIRRKKLYRELLELRVFDKAVEIRKKNGVREYAALNLEEEPCC